MGAENLAPPPGFDPQTIQSVASHYTECAIPAPATVRTSSIICRTRDGNLIYLVLITDDLFQRHFPTVLGDM